MKIAKPSLTLKHPRRWIIISISALLLAALGTYAVLSVRYWQDYHQRIETADSGLKSSIDGAFANPKGFLTDRLDTVAATFVKKNGATPCETNRWFGWQTVLPQVKALRMACDDHSKETTAVLEALRPLSRFLKAETRAAGVVSSLVTITKDDPEYAKTAASWLDVKNASDVSSEAVFTPVRNKILEVSASLAAAYTALDDANKKEDKAAFDKALTDLQAAYARIDEIKTVDNAERDKLANAFAAAYEKL